MAQQTVVTITHDTEDNGTVVSKFKQATDRPRHEALAVAAHVEALAGGLKTGHLQVKVQSDDAVAASATCTFAAALNNDTVTIGAVTLTGVTGTPSGQAQFKVGVSNTADAAAFAACVNAHTSLKSFVSASSASAVATVKATHLGVIGNSIPFTSSNGTRLAVTGSGFLASGAEPTNTDYSPNDYSFGK